MALGSHALVKTCNNFVLASFFFFFLYIYKLASVFRNNYIDVALFYYSISGIQDYATLEYTKYTVKAEISTNPDKHHLSRNDMPKMDTTGRICLPKYTNIVTIIHKKMQVARMMVHFE